MSRPAPWAGVRAEGRSVGGSWQVLEDLPRNTTSTSVDELEHGATWDFRVRAYNEGGNATSNVIQIDLSSALPPAAPSGLTGEALSPTSASLSWNDNSNNEDGFRVQGRQEGGSWQTLATVPANTTSATPGDLVSGAVYDFRVLAYNENGNSESNTITVDLPEPPPDPEPPTAPSNLTGVALSSTSASLL